ncbi:MAG TPA: PA2779 family protein [Usitatibacter sp.]|nr:PA2779 family protein [Usitatibacter sp.]
MKPFVVRSLSRLLIACLMLMSFGTASAGMIGVDQLSASVGATTDRAALMTILARGDVQSQLQAQGVDPSAARERVAAMTDSEVSSVMGQIDALPAGASSNNGWYWGAAVIVAIIVWYMWFS